ncbi:MAG: hypothetical protein DI539_15740 [Flavobacterium psychrophilum]|nr:MAG: hypothetical protein DI539_15740 [Flavobacterium psychrophilum]
MLKLKPYSSTLLALEGILLMAMGLYFAFLRPSLLPEDIRYLKISLSDIEHSVPSLTVWLQRVFWVMGSYIFTTGLLIIFISQTSFRTRTQGTFYIVALAGISSIGSMTVINFMIGSDFKWILLLFTVPWIVSLTLYRIDK